MLGNILSEAVLNIKCEKMQGKQNWEEIGWLCTARTGLSGTAKQTYSFYFCVAVYVFFVDTNNSRAKKPFVLAKACDTFYCLSSHIISTALTLYLNVNIDRS